MANIYDSRVGRFNPRLASYTQTLDIPSISTSYLGDLVDTQEDLLKTDLERVESSLEQLGEIEDQVLKFRTDNPTQQELKNKAYARVGLDENSFRFTEQDLRSPLKMREVERRVANFYSQPEVRELMTEQLISDEFYKSANKIKNSSLKARALSQYQQYKLGNVSGAELDISDFKEIDVNKLLRNTYKEIDESLSLRENAELSRDGFKAFDKIALRNSEEIDAATGSLVRNRALLENIKAENGFATDEQAIGLINTFADRFKKERVEDVILRNAPRTSTSTPTSRNSNTSSSRFSGNSELSRSMNALDKFLEDNNFELLDEAVAMGMKGYRDLKIVEEDGKNFLQYKLSTSADAEPIRIELTSKGPSKPTETERRAADILKAEEDQALSDFNEFIKTNTAVGEDETPAESALSFTPELDTIDTEIVVDTTSSEINMDNVRSIFGGAQDTSVEEEAPEEVDKGVNLLADPITTLSAVNRARKIKKATIDVGQEIQDEIDEIDARVQEIDELLEKKRGKKSISGKIDLKGIEKLKKEKEEAQLRKQKLILKRNKG